MPRPILLYDGVCGLCNRFVQFILRRDRDAKFRFASLQSASAARILARHGVNPGTDLSANPSSDAANLDTVYVVLDHELPDESLLSRSAAVLFVLKQLPGFWRPVASLLQLLPKVVRDAAYNAVARNRYRIFGRQDVCALPTPDPNRFFDQ
jgi:predicted DCC family thiol-disulfide oxidoreductase YuxK